MSHDSLRRGRTMTPAALALALAVAAFGGAAQAHGVQVRTDASPTGSIFPSNRFTVPDFTQRTLRRVALPKPDCALQPSDCADIDVLNTLDGFSTQPRIMVPFTGDIDPASVSSETVYLVNLGNTLSGHGFGERVGINQVVWDPASKVLAFQSDELLQQHSRYLVVVTDGVRDAQGQPLQGWSGSLGHTAYGQELRSALHQGRQGGHRIVAASLFTTQTISADLEKINRQIKRSQPAPIDFNLGQSAAGGVRSVFPVATLAGIQWNRQIGTAPAFSQSFVPTPALGVVAGSVAQVAYGRFSAPSYQTAAKVIPATGTLTGRPQPQGSEQLVVQVFVPAGTKPAGGWPVALFGHGFTDSMYGAPWAVAAVMASRGLATVSINVVGHGGGAASTLNVLTAAGPVVVPAGGRGIDQDGNGTIDSTEGVNAAAPQTLVSSRDGLRQTVIDYMQLVRQIEAGVDVDGDGSVDLDANRIYYSGQSFGGIYGTILLGTEPSLKAGVPNVPGGSISEIARLSPVFRVLSGLTLATRVPTLLNLPPTATLPVPLNFNENIPLRNQPPLVNNVPGAMAIQAFLDVAQWATQSGNPVSYAPYLRKQPLPGHVAKPVILQFAKGDLTVPNPTTSAIIRAGDLAAHTVLFRNDLAYAQNPGVGRNPHTFLTNIGNPLAAPYAVGGQQQIAIFFASHGTTVIDPDGANGLFEVPLVGPPPEVTSYIP